MLDVFGEYLDQTRHGSVIRHKATGVRLVRLEPNEFRDIHETSVCVIGTGRLGNISEYLSDDIPFADQFEVEP